MTAEHDNANSLPAIALVAFVVGVGVGVLWIGEWASSHARESCRQAGYQSAKWTVKGTTCLTTIKTPLTEAAAK